MIRLLLILPLLGCRDPKDCTCDDTNSGTDTDSDTNTDSHADTGVDTVDSCVAPDLAVCYQFDGYGDTRGWCESLFTTYGTTAIYSDEGCAAGAVAMCLVPAGSGGDHEYTAYYYDPDWDYESAVEACTVVGGTPL